ncbi:hypothetical protein [Salinigranum sp. GCM10025319]|uniref:hypothetical protein n=1 Tax=Salinigranum sp. GCM10025319 TaxID=3252687 RepID=UPI00360C5A97
MADRTGVFVALLGVGIALVTLIRGDESSGDLGSGSSNQESNQGFYEEIVNRTGSLPSGFDAADRVRQIGQDEFQDHYEPGDGGVGL